MASRPWNSPKGFNSKDRKKYAKNVKFYRSAMWVRISKIVRSQDKLCQEGFRTNDHPFKGCDHCDHIIPVEYGGHPTARENLWGLCESCHNRKSACEQNRGPLFRFTGEWGFRIPIRDEDGLPSQSPI